MACMRNCDNGRLNKLQLLARSLNCTACVCVCVSHARLSAPHTSAYVANVHSYNTQFVSFNRPSP